MVRTSKDPLKIGKRLRAGDLRALEDLLRTHAPSVLGQLVRKFKGTLTREDSEEVVSEALNTVWHLRERFDPRRGSVFDWFHHISVHLALDLTRKKKRARMDTAGDHILDTIASASATDESVTNGHVSLFADIAAIIEELSPSQRAIILADIKHFPGVAPSRLFGPDLGIDPDSVPVYRERARKKIRGELIRRGYRFDEPKG